MTTDTTSRGSLPSIIRNDAQLYEGNLAHYFRAVFNNARNLRHPYHNFRHMFHVVWLCYGACHFYQKNLTPRQMRNLLIAAIFHDFDHSGTMGDDDLNIARAIRGLQKHILEEDKDSFEDISELIVATEYPHRKAHRLNLRSHIIRDADLSQGLSVAWIQQVIFGLADEWGQNPLKVLRAQIEFFGNLRYHTDWAQQHFSQQDIEMKINEAREFLDLLEFTTVPAPGT